MLETEIETYKWWKDEDLIKQFDEEYENYLSGKDKSYSLKEMNQKLGKLKKELKSE
jgi:hypothetical protein